MTRAESWTQPGQSEPYTFGTGRSGDHPDARQYVQSLNRAGYNGAVAAFRDWSRARWDHAETSFYGRARIDAMRAFWLGVAWGIRERDGRAPFTLPLSSNSAPVSGLVRRQS